MQNGRLKKIFKFLFRFQNFKHLIYLPRVNITIISAIYHNYVNALYRKLTKICSRKYSELFGIKIFFS